VCQAGQVLICFAPHWLQRRRRLADGQVCAPATTAPRKNGSLLRKSNKPNGANRRPSQYCEREPVNASGASVDQVDCLVRADIDIGHIRRLTVGVFPAQIQVTTLDLGYFGPRPLAGFQRA
jgi:hypothetical protein